MKKKLLSRRNTIVAIFGGTLILLFTLLLLLKKEIFSILILVDLFIFFLVFILDCLNPKVNNWINKKSNIQNNNSILNNSNKTVGHQFNIISFLTVENQKLRSEIINYCSNFCNNKGFCSICPLRKINKKYEKI